MSDITPTPSNNIPAVSDKTRTAIYVASLAINVIVIVGFGLGALFGFVDPVKAATATTIILGGIGLVSNGLAVGYRPTR